MNSLQNKYKYTGLTKQQEIDLYRKKVEDQYKKDLIAQQKLYDDYLKIVESEYLKYELAKPQQEEKKDAGFLKKSGKTALDFLGGEVLGGALGTLEGAFDYIRGLGAKAYSYTKPKEERDAYLQMVYEGNPFTGVKGISYDGTREKVVEPIREWVGEDSYIDTMSPKGQQIVRGVGQGIGQMLPSIALTAMGAPSVAGTAMFGTGAAGRGLEEAYSEGATINQSLLYGTASGAFETAIEMISGSVGNQLSGIPAFANIGDKIAANVGGNAMAQIGLKLLADAGGEAVEEMIGEWIDPKLKKLIYDPNVPDATKEEILMAGLIGGLTSLAMGGMGTAIQGKNVTLLNMHQEQLQDINKQYQKLTQDTKLSTDEYFKSKQDLNTKREGVVTQINQTLDSMKDNTKKAYIEKYGDATQQVDFVNYNVKDFNNLSNEQKENIRVAERTFNKLNEKSKNRRLRLEFSDQLDKNINGKYSDGVITVNINAKQPLQTIVVHEVTHSLEGTKGYNDYANYILTAINNSPELKQKYGDLLDKFNNTADLYADVIDSKGLTIEQAQQEILTEMVAQYTSENLFTNEQAIMRLAQDNPNMAKRILNWIKSTISKLKGGTKEEQEVANFLKNAEKLYSKALETDYASVDSKLSINEQTEKKDNKVLTEIPMQEKSKLEKIRDLKLASQIKFTNAQAGYEYAAKQMGMENAEIITHWARSSQNAANEMIVTAQFDANFKKVGKSLKDIMAPIEAKGQAYKSEFFDYLANYHNIDRIAQEKPLLTKTAEESKKIIKDYETKYPEFKTQAQEVWKYADNLLQLRVDSGLYTQEFIDNLRKIYPHYIPSFRDTDGSSQGTGGLFGNKNVAVTSTIKKASGSELDILPIDVVLGRQTIQTIKADRINQMAESLYDQAIKSQDFRFVEVVEKKKVKSKDIDVDIDIDIDASLNPKTHEVSFYKDGERITLKVVPEVFEGFNALAPKSDVITNPFIQASTKINTTFKQLVTGYNPFFLARNFVRDMQDLAIYSKYITEFPKSYKQAIQEVKNNSELWQQYKAAGGLSSTVFDYNKGIQKDPTGAFGKALNKFENANMIIEQLPRFAEYISSLKAGNSVQQALLDSADVTVNFSRSGTFTKVLNNSVVPFLNPAIQGFSKMYRVVVSAKTARQIGGLLTKAALLGILPSVLNNMLYSDDDDYNALSDRDKDNNYVFKIGKNFLKIPKGRIQSVLGSAVNRAKRSTEGDEFAWDGFVDNAIGQVTPIENMSRWIFSPFSDVKNNRTWYGSKIEADRFKNIRPSERYDEATSDIAIQLGKHLNYSPKKIHYLIDQYSGIIGDILLPLTTKKAERGVVQQNFTIDPILSNKYSNNFSKTLEQANYKKADGDMVATAKVRFLNKINSQVNEMYQAIREIENSNLRDKEKQTQVRAIRMMLNNLYKNAIINSKDFERTLSNFELSELSFDDDYREALRITFGAEYALSNYNKQTYEKGMILSKANISFDTFYNVYFDAKDILPDYNEDGSVVYNSKKNKVIKYLNSLDIPAPQKYILLGSLGYKNTYGKKLVRDYIQSLPLSKVEKEELWKMAGY